MSFRVTNDVRDAQCPPTARLVLYAMASYADDGGHCHPSVETLMHDTGLTRRAVQCQLRALERRGELERISPGMGGRWKSTRYRIRVRKGASHAPFLPTERGHLATRKGASDDLKGRTTCAQKVREGEKRESACAADAAPLSGDSPLQARTGERAQEAEGGPPATSGRRKGRSPGASVPVSPRRAAAADLDLPALLAAPAVATALQAHGWNGEHAHLAAGAWGPSLDLWRAKRTAKWGGRRRTADDWAADMAGWVRGETRPPAPPQKERESISAQWRRETREMQEAEARRKAAEGVVIKLADRPTKRSAS